MKIATFNVENLDDLPIPEERVDKEPTFEERLPILRNQMLRLDADILCLQEVHGQNVEGSPRQLRALRRILAGTKYEQFHVHTTLLKGRTDVERYRNLVTLINPEYHFTDDRGREIINEFVDKPAHRFATGSRKGDVVDVGWNRPLLYSQVVLPHGKLIHVINAHFKSKNPTPVEGEGPRNFKWESAAGWAEGFFLSALKRVGQALETRIFVDSIFEVDPNANVVVAGDLNSEVDEVPLQALRGQVEDTGNSELNGRILYPIEHTVPKSARFSLYHHGRPNLLDHLLISQNMMAGYNTTHIHNELVHDESVAFAYDKKFPASDHAPIVAEFREELL